MTTYYYQIKKSERYQHIKELNILPNDIVIMMLEYAATFKEKYIGHWGSYGKNDGQFDRPAGIFALDNLIYVADRGNNRIQVFDQQGKFLRKWGSKGILNGEFDHPYGIAEMDGLIYVADAGNDRIQIFDCTENETKFVGKLTSENINYPTNIAIVDKQIYIVNDAKGISIFNLDDGLVKMTIHDKIICNNISGIALNSDNIFITNYSTDLIGKIDLEGNIIKVWGGSESSSDNFDSPECLAIIDQMLYICDTKNHRIQIDDTDGKIIRSINLEQIVDLNQDNEIISCPRPYGVTTDGNKIYISDESNDVIYVFEKVINLD